MTKKEKRQETTSRKLLVDPAQKHKEVAQQKIQGTLNLPRHADSSRMQTEAVPHKVLGQEAHLVMPLTHCPLPREASI